MTQDLNKVLFLRISIFPKAETAELERVANIIDILRNKIGAANLDHNMQINGKYEIDVFVDHALTCSMKQPLLEGLTAPHIANAISEIYEYYDRKSPLNMGNGNSCNEHLVHNKLNK